MKHLLLSLSLSFVILTAGCGLNADSTNAQTPIFPDTTMVNGGSIQTKLSRNIIVNDNSSLNRVWVAVHDNNMPIQFYGTPGITTVYESGGTYSSGDYRYRSTAVLTTTLQDVTAFEVRYITFDVFGQRMDNFSATEVMDFSKDSSQTFSWAWRAYRENDVSEYFASIVYIAKVRTIDGNIYETNIEEVLEVAKQFQQDITVADIETDDEE